MVFIHLCHSALNQIWIQMRQMEGAICSPLACQRQKALPLFDFFWAYNNSSAELPFQPVFSLNDAVLQLHINPLPAWAEELTADYR